jgi:hypothetical protein
LVEGAIDDLSAGRHQAYVARLSPESRPWYAYNGLIVLAELATDSPYPSVDHELEQLLLRIDESTRTAAEWPVGLRGNEAKREAALRIVQRISAVGDEEVVVPVVRMLLRRREAGMGPSVSALLERSKSFPVIIQEDRATITSVLRKSVVKFICIDGTWHFDYAM